jgi:hypothetical protein
MGRNQGTRRLKAGISRRLTVSEASRGYLYITMDPKMDFKLKGDGIETVVNGKSIGKRATDAYGRIGVSRTIIGSSKGQPVQMGIAGDKLVIDIG